MWDSDASFAKGSRDETICNSFVLSLLATLTTTLPAAAQTPALPEAQAQAIAREAYLYFYPLVTMDVTRKQLINTEPGKVSAGP